MAMAQAVPSLRWIGSYVQVKDGPSWLYSWSVSRRAQEFAHNAPPAVTLAEMSEDAGWRVLRAEEMGELARAS